MSKKTSNRTVPVAITAKTTECQFAPDPKTGDFVLSATAGCDPRSALRQAAELLDVANSVSRDMMTDELMEETRGTLLNLAISTASALVHAAERGMSADAPAA